MITVTYSTIDRFRKTRSFKTLVGARKFAHHWVGATPEIGSTYAVSGDGVGKITVEGVPLADLFDGAAEDMAYKMKPAPLDHAYKADKAAVDAAWARAVASGSEADNELYFALQAEFDWTYAPSMTAEEREMMAVEMADKIKRRGAT